ncbi:MAG: ABC transporter permease [Oceanisphaera sp.]|uniref:ABC transporter permease n=1 Tax=unclassified Oceanisphaera TaxID=2641353 RepID=UPI0029C9D0BB|nr:ABC transporter permease [Oceanisphaera sp. IT1-181]
MNKSLKAPLLARLTVNGLLILLVAPIMTTLVYSLSAQWGAHILPRGFTFDWYITLWSDSRFLAAFARSLLVCLAALLLSLLLILPTLFVVFYYFPRLKSLMNLLILLPFAVPPVVSSVGLLQLYAGGPLPLIGGPWILIFCYFTISLPFMYRALANNLDAIPLSDLIDAAHLLGASTVLAFLRVVLPNIRNGLLAALFLSFSFLFGEFVFANMLVGTRFETLQVYLYSQRTNSGHFTSAMVMSYFLFIGVATWFALRLQTRSR